MRTQRRPASRHSQPRTKSIPIHYVIAMLLGAALSGVAWVYLVLSAIEFGRLARDGQPKAWVFTGAASLGAVVCAVLVLVLVARALRSLALIGGHRSRSGVPHRHSK